MNINIAHVMLQTRLVVKTENLQKKLKARLLHRQLEFCNGNFNAMN